MLHGPGKVEKVRVKGEGFGTKAYSEKLHSLKLTASLPLKMDGWNTSLSYWGGLFSGALAVSFREGNTNSTKLVGEFDRMFLPVFHACGPFFKFHGC